MAKTNRSTTARRTGNSARNSRGMYVEGNTARRLAEVPDRRNQSYGQNAGQVRRRPRTNTKTREQRETLERRQVSKEAIRNREKAMGMSRGFVVFLAAVSVAVLFFSTHYIQLKSEITARLREVAALESELSQLKEDNDAYYSQVTSNVDLTSIKKVAIGRLGMKYPSDDQTVTYETSRSSYVRQYQDVPDSK